MFRRIAVAISIAVALVFAAAPAGAAELKVMGAGPVEGTVKELVPAAVETARVATIRAPITGRTGSVAFKRGNIVKAVDTAQVVLPLVTITQVRPIYVVFTIPERHLSDLRAAQAAGRLPVTVTVPDQPQSQVTGTLTFIDNQVDAATGTISLKATFANDDTRLWPGQFVSVTLQLGTQENAVAAPSVGIQIGQNGPCVFLIKDDSTVELRLVKVDRTVGNKTVIAQGLAAGDRIVVDGQLRLGNGMRVNVQRAETPTAPKAQSVPVAERAP